MVMLFVYIFVKVAYVYTFTHAVGLPVLPTPTRYTVQSSSFGTESSISGISSNAMMKSSSVPIPSGGSSSHILCE